MSSLATPDNASSPSFGSNDLIIISDGSSLWTPVASQSTEIEWQFEVITQLMQALPPTITPVLIGAPSVNAKQLTSYAAGYTWEEWGTQSAKAANLYTIHRFPDTDRENGCFGSTDLGHTRVELWFLTEDSFYTGTRGSQSYGWFNTLRRLGFDVSKWDTSLSLTENLCAQHVSDIFSGTTRPSGIVVVNLAHNALTTQRFELI